MTPVEFEFVDLIASAAYLSSLRAEFGELDNYEVVITKESMAHILLRHADAAEPLRQYVAKCVTDPDYIFQDPNKEATAWFVLEIPERYIRLVIRLSLAREGSGLKNSIITGHMLSKKKLEKMRRNAKLIYKRA